MKHKSVKFLVEGKINNKIEKVIYEYKHKKGNINGDPMSMFMLQSALERKTPVGPVGMYLERNINDPLAMLSILTSDEIFEQVINVELISGEMPVAPELPKGAI